MVFLVLDATGLVVNAIVAAGVEAAAVPAGCSALPREDGAGIGWQRVDGQWVAPPAGDVEV